jgi:hypothetical protein
MVAAAPAALLVLGNPVVEAVGVSLLVVTEGTAEDASDLMELRTELTAEETLARLHIC